MVMKRVLRDGDVLEVQSQGTAQGTRTKINFTDAEVTVADNVAQGRVDVTIANVANIPANKPLVDADISATANIAKTKISSTGQWSSAEIPNLDASKITSGLLAEARGGLGKAVDATARANDTIIVYKTASDSYVHEAKGTPSLHADTHKPATGSDPLATATPSDIGTANATGTGDAFARVDHVHNHPNIAQDLHSVYILADGSRAMTGELKADQGVYINNEGKAFIIDALNNRRFGIVKESGFDSEIRYLTSIPLRFRRITAGTIESPTASGVVLELTTAGKVLAEGNDVNAHAGRHSGADPLTVGTPANIGTANSAGSATDYVRRDHVHAHPNLGDLHTVYLLADGTRVMTGALRLEQRTTDPTLGANDHGFLWFRDDTNELKYSHDDGAGGTAVKTLAADAESVFFSTGLMHSLSVNDLDLSGTAGAWTKEGLIGTLETNATNGAQVAAKVQWQDSAGGLSGESGAPLYDKFPQFEVALRLATTTNQDIWIIWGGSANTPSTATEKKFGLHILNNSLRTFSSDGVTQTETAEQQALNANQWYRIRIKRNSTAIKTWIDGTLKTDKTTNIPAGAPDDSAVFQVVIKANEAVAKKLYIRPVKLATAA